MKTYPLGDYMSLAERDSLLKGQPKGVCVKAISAGETREPKKGEWFLSGARIEAYKAHNDLTSNYPIAKLVRVKVETKTIETIIP